MERIRGRLTKMRTFIDILPDLLKTKRCNVQILASTKDGWFFHFSLWDDEHDCWIEGNRIIPKTTLFEGDQDLLCELWCTPNLVEI